MTTRQLTNQPDTPFKVLIVEDQPINQTVIALMLQRLGYRYEIVENGEQAVLHRFSNTPYHLIFMDLRMPVLDGYDATLQIRQLEQERLCDPIPIVALTADAFHEVAERCLAIGMNAYLTKPVVLKEVQRVLQRWIPLPPPESPVED